MTKIEPTGDHIVVEPIEEEVTSTSGIIIPETASKERPMKGKVVAVGPGKLLDDGSRKGMDVAKGDVVLYTRYGPTEVKLDGKEILILTMADVLATIN
ncbi:co-chaperone GroES [Candidatus Peregrinibacteria bacterium]|jgi:chaperonin GroES|nr:co-chaperone GroES [Candidatus Peregrinibacteria bacterium]MBT4055724.1 co-chaperone GroES [Candidatus Peregrinibacteria bacterium]